MSKQPQPQFTNEDRIELIEAVAMMVHEDFPECDGTGSIFCPACTAVRSVHNLMEVYEDLDIERIADESIKESKNGKSG